jgi:hypothetical protein
MSLDLDALAELLDQGQQSFGVALGLVVAELCQRGYAVGEGH